jgi:carbamoyltransferase
MLILGISSFKNDSAAALLRDGVIEAAIENEKLQGTSIRSVPEAAIDFCLEKVQNGGSSLDVVALASNPFRGWKRRAFSRARLSAFAPIGTAYQEAKELDRLSWDWAALRGLRQRFAKSSTKVITLDHHLCHASSAFFLSSFDRALILTLDGEGDGQAGMIAVGQGNQIRVRKTIPVTHSLGWVYSRITDLLGFVPHREEHKTQWLSLEGEPAFKQEFLKMLRRPGSPFPHIDLTYFHSELTGTFEPSKLFYERMGIDGPGGSLTPEHKRMLAASLQAALAEVVTDLLAFLQKETGASRICLGGGVFHNTLLVAHLEREFGAGNIYVPPAPGSAGCALGAASWIWHQQMKKPRGPEAASVYWGPAYARTDVKDVLDNSKARYSLRNTTDRKVETAVQLLHAGNIVGWFQGATEFGPRTLGNRSILASPWAPYVVENLNDFVKHRESFRPFAVAVPEEEYARYFEASPLCRTMNSLASVKPGINVLPAAFQLPGGLVRLHVVEKRANPLFWELLKRFGEHNPAPLLLNTSFNLPGERPVVRPKDALRTYFCSGIDAVFIDNFLLTKWSAAHVLSRTTAGSSQVTMSA